MEKLVNNNEIMDVKSDELKMYLNLVGVFRVMSGDEE